jgi:hypothetical protein
MVSSYNLRSRARKHNTATATRSYIVNGLQTKIPNVILKRGWNPCSLLTAQVRESEFEVKASSIPAAGLGVFTKRNIPKGKRVLEYKGQFLHENSNSSLMDKSNSNIAATATAELVQCNDDSDDDAVIVDDDTDDEDENENESGDNMAHGEHKYCFELSAGDPVCLCAIMPSEPLKTNDDFLHPKNVSIAGRVNDLDYDFKRRRYRPKRLRKNNLDWLVTDNQQVFLVSMRSIKKGEELGIDYGSGYWKRH